MRALEFIVDKQIIRRDPNCDFNGLVAGSSGYLLAHFTFSSDWNKCIKVASFWQGGKEYAVILDGDSCSIPSEALIGATFKVSVTGKRGDYKIPTNRILIRQGAR